MIKVKEELEGYEEREDLFNGTLKAQTDSVSARREQNKSKW
jgi:hypothetical protein